MQASVHADPWLCPPWMQHWAPRCSCQGLRTQAFLDPFLGFGSEDDARSRVQANVHEWCKAQWSVNGPNFIRDVSHACVSSASPAAAWFMPALYEAVVHEWHTHIVPHLSRPATPRVADSIDALLYNPSTKRWSPSDIARPVLSAVLDPWYVHMFKDVPTLREDDKAWIAKYPGKSSKDILGW